MSWWFIKDTSPSGIKSQLPWQIAVTFFIFDLSTSFILSQRDTLCPLKDQRCYDWGKQKEDTQLQKPWHYNIIHGFVMQPAWTPVALYVPVGKVVWWKTEYIIINGFLCVTASLLFINNTIFDVNSTESQKRHYFLTITIV